MSDPPITSQQAPVRQPHAVGTFTFNRPARLTTPAAIIGATRRSRRLAGESADLDVWPPQGTPDQRRGRSDASSQQLHPPPPSGEFTFRHSEPSVPAPGFSHHSSLGMGSMLSHQNADQLNQTSPRRMRIFPRRDNSITSTGNELSAPAMETAGSTFGMASHLQNQRQGQAFTQLPESALRTHAARQSSLEANIEDTVHFPPLPNSNGDSQSIRTGLQITNVGQVSLDSSNPWSSFSLGASPNHRPTENLRVDANPFAAPFPPFPHPPAVPNGQSKPESPKCTICCDPDTLQAELVQPCIDCESFYCFECIKEMFEASLTDMTRMPARCCSIIQLPLAIPHITPEQANTYRARFEEWMATTRTYCPVPKCSAFIGERFLLPATKPAPIIWDIMHPHLRSILRTLNQSPDARFFRSITSPKQHEITDWNRKVQKPIFLEMIERKLSSYASLSQFMSDMDLLWENANRFRNGEYDAVSMAGDDLRRLFYEEFNNVKVGVEPASAKSLPDNACFACPKCFTAICSECKQIAHPLKPCDTTFHDHEAAMLATFGYKRCPKCGHGVKKMYGCRHMQCQCGAHWCYYCQKPIDECDAQGCGASEASDFDEDDYEGLEGEGDDDNIEDDDIALLEVAEGSAATAPAPSDHAGVVQQSADTKPIEAVSSEAPGNGAIRTPSMAPEIDLDAGGARRWDGMGDFGEEPDEPGATDIAWSCKHAFKVHVIDATKVENGYPLQLECNRCFSEVHAEKKDHLKPSGNTSKAESKRMKLKNMAIKTDKKEIDSVAQQKEATWEKKPGAWSCDVCTLVVCKECKEHYVAEKDATEVKEKKRTRH